MKKRTIRAIHSAQRDDIEDLVTRRPLPSSQLEQIDPFLFLNHHGPQIYPKNNQGLPFGPHPHRGFETVTFILKGELSHQDTGGHDSVIRAGGVQWMTAGRGLVHSELSPSDFLKNGGDLEILQLWVNLPSRLKMTDPAYTGLQREQIPNISLNDGEVDVQLISGELQGQKGPIESLTDVQAMVLKFTKPSSSPVTVHIPPERNIFFYIVSGQVQIEDRQIQKFHLVEFKADGDTLAFQSSSEETVILLCHAKALNEPVVSYGPFVMNTRDEIRQAIQDYQAGRFA
jgi:hypothetical protein